MDKDREKQTSSSSMNGEEEVAGYEAPEITKHEVLRDLTATGSIGEPSSP